MVKYDGWLPGIGYFKTYRPLFPIKVFLFWFISYTLNVSLKKLLPGSALVGAGVGNLYLGNNGSTTLLVLN